MNVQEAAENEALHCCVHRPASPMPGCRVPVMALSLQDGMSKQLRNVVLEASTCLGRPSMEHLSTEDFEKKNT